MDARRCHPAVDDGDGIYGLCPAMGPDELLGCDGDHQLVLRPPVYRRSIVVWLWGGFSVDNPTLSRFFALHYLMPFLIVGVVILHIVALHRFGSNNPLGIDVSGKQDTLPFHPYYTSKDLFGAVVFLTIFASAVFFYPNYLGHPDNYIPANPLQTPAHIVPEWYFLPFYAILRAIPDKLGGVLFMFGAIAVLFILPWLDKSPVRSGRFRPIFKVFFWLLLLDCVVLGYLGAKPAEGVYVVASRIATAWYFFHFLIVLPVLTMVEKTRPLPQAITAPISGGGAMAGATAAVRRSPMRKFTVSALAAALMLSVSSAFAAGAGGKITERDWSFSGPFGSFDQASLQRGFQVYREVCSGCHGLDYIAFRNLADLGITKLRSKPLPRNMK